MHFLILAMDYTDEGAIARRTAAREAHLAFSDVAAKKGEQLMGVALLDDDEKMVGSTMVVEFPARADVEVWLKVEPYITGKVWEHVEIIPCKVGPSFS